MLFTWYDWGRTPEGISLLSDTADPAPGPRLSRANAAQLAKVLTAVIRNERFCEGYLDGAFDSGLLLAIVRRAKELAEAADADVDASDLTPGLVRDEVLDAIENGDRRRKMVPAGVVQGARVQTGYHRHAGLGRLSKGTPDRGRVENNQHRTPEARVFPATGAPTPAAGPFDSRCDEAMVWDDTRGFFRCSVLCPDRSSVRCPNGCVAIAARTAAMIT